MATATTVDSTIKTRDGVIKNVVIAGTPIYRVVAEGHIVFDRKDYTLTRNSNYSYSAPITGGTVSFPSTAITSTFDGYNASGTRVNGASADYSVSPASITSNAHNTTSRSGNLTVSQDNSGLEITIPYSQSADSYEDVNVCTGLTVTLSNVAVIPASGGSVNSCDVSVTANGYVRHDWISGDSTTGSTTSWTLTSSEYTLSWTGVSANSKGETPSQQTTAGTLTCKATYKANTSITGQGTSTVYQQANERTGWTSWEYDLSVSTNVVGTYTSAGGTVGIDYSGQKKHKPIYTSKATGNTYSYEDIICDLATTTGTLATNSVAGTGNTTLTVPANTTSNRTITITLYYADDHTKKATTSFTQSYSTSSFAYAYLSNFTGNGQITSWSTVKEAAKEISNWTSPTQNVYQVVADGSTKYRTGSTANAGMVQADTYFYNNDSYTFYTRNVTTAGAAGTEHFWYKNPNLSFNAPANIDATATTFTMYGSTANCKYYVTVKEGTNPIMTKTLYTGGTLTVNCGANQSTTNTRTFTVSFEDYYNTENADWSDISVVQANKPANSISLDTDKLDFYNCTIPSQSTVEVTTVGGGWTCTYDSNYFTVSPAAGNEGTTRVTVTAIAQGTEGAQPRLIRFVHNILSVGRVTLSVNYYDC